jgi:hypothetical protein
MNRNNLKGLQIVLFAIVFCFVGCSNNSTKNENVPSKTIAQNDTFDVKKDTTFVSASNLYRVYYQNEVNADKMFKGKTFNLIGNVVSINKGVSDNVYLILGGDIQCNLRDDQSGFAANLFRGQKILLRGTGAGYLLGNIQMANCQIVRVGKR